MEITNSSHDIISINIKMRNKEKGLLFVTPSKKTLQPKSTQIIKMYFELLFILINVILTPYF